MYNFSRWNRSLLHLSGRPRVVRPDGECGWLGGAPRTRPTVASNIHVARQQLQGGGAVGRVWDGWRQRVTLTAEFEWRFRAGSQENPRVVCPCRASHAAERATIPAAKSSDSCRTAVVATRAIDSCTRLPEPLSESVQLRSSDKHSNKKTERGSGASRQSL